MLKFDQRLGVSDKTFTVFNHRVNAHSLTTAFAGRTYHIVGNLMWRLICFGCSIEWVQYPQHVAWWRNKKRIGFIIPMWQPG